MRDYVFLISVIIKKHSDFERLDFFPFECIQNSEFDYISDGKLSNLLCETSVGSKQV